MYLKLFKGLIIYVLQTFEKYGWDVYDIISYSRSIKYFSTKDIRLFEKLNMQNAGTIIL